MRVLAMILLLGLIGAGTIFILGPRDEATAEASSGGFLQDLGDQALAVLDRAGGDAPEAADAAGSAGGAAYYQYTDDRGTVHFVTSLEAVPARFRGDVGKVKMDPVARSEKRAPKRSANRSASRAAAEPAAARGQHEVVVYTTSWCGWCRKTLAFLDEQGVDYVNKDIEANDHNRDELIRKSGRTSIPVVDIDGEIIRGYDPGRMQALLGL